MITPDTPIERMPKVAKAIVSALKRLGIHTVRDLLMHIPSRYEDFSNKKPIREVAPGEMVTIQGTVRTISHFRTQTGKVMTQATVDDEGGTIKAVWFNQPYLSRNLGSGDMVNLSGKAELRKGGMSLQNPSYEKISSKAQKIMSVPLHTGKLVPIYPETRGITSRWLRYLISSYLSLREQMEDPLPGDVRKKFDLMELKDAIAYIHAPRREEDIVRARKRFEFENLFFVQLYSLRERIAMQQHRAPHIPASLERIKEFVGSLPFALTDAQRRSCWEIMRDMEKPIPMNRLLQGDVGSGKTVVAAAALLLATSAGKRACLLAPTEILAKQHAQTIEKLLAPFGVRIGVYTSSEKKIPVKSSVFVGTHALLQKNIRISNLGLVIVDEQHRFGVEQRAALLQHHRTESEYPHFLSMTATPIPRTLALTIYGDLDVSLLDEMPKNRKAIITRVVDPHHHDDAYEFIRREMKQGRQVFVICPHIEIPEESDAPLKGKKTQISLLAAEVRTVTEEYESLSRKIFPDFSVGMLHGKMKAQEKARVMREFYEHKIDILVSTSVVEVGVDVPNASVMMIEGAERFGLAQLHQFRGRVGRGSEQSYCFLFPTEHGMAAQRLQALARAVNGFELAEIDMKLRGPGEFLGTKQSGISSLGMSALTNTALVRDVRSAARDLTAQDPLLYDHPLLKERINALARIIHRE
ncbi:MAG: ATP-dependent DNA helicase RecG [bacterium]|nr:ATP-dependent DNA helicase RecG [bacterium]